MIGPAVAGSCTDRIGPRTMTYQPGDTIDGKYRIVRLLGEGGMGAVYEGENTRIHRRVAIKVLHAAIAAKADVVQRFEREAQAAGRIGSEHIVEVLDLGSSGSDRFMVMEFLEGESLGDRIRRKQRLAPHELASILHQMLAGLGAAHGAGIIHRDLKPDNLFLLHSRAGHRDFVKILDFGVSKFTALEHDLSMTKTGSVVGTPFYMSPEQARGQEVDARSDLFSVGVVAYQAVTGRVPFNAATFNELVFKIALESPEPARTLAPDLDPGFAAIIERAMTRDPAGRYQTAAEMAAAIATWAATAGLALDRTDTHLPAGVAGAMRGVSAVDLGLAKTLAGDSAAEATPASARPGRRIAVAAAAVLALAVGGLGAFFLLGRGTHHVASAPPAPTVAQTAPPLPAPVPTVAQTAAPVAVATATAEPAAVEPAKAPKVKTSATPKASAAPKATEKPAAGPAPAPTPGPSVRTIGSEL
jgi:serine/threonine-protein kinase